MSTAKHQTEYPFLAGVHNQVKDDGSLRDVDEIYIHPNWSPFSSENRNDIAILHLSTPLDFVNNPLVRRTCVPHVQWPTNVVEVSSEPYTFSRHWLGRPTYEHYW